LIRSLELVMLGEIVLPPSLVLSAMEDLSYRGGYLGGCLNEQEGCDLKGRKLSNRESEILLCMKEGAPNKLIARKLNLSEATVKVHVKAILKKIGAMNRTQAALWAAQNMAVVSAQSEVELHEL
jgi:two-component system nitrate/nitrite response regulator NarL